MLQKLESDVLDEEASIKISSSDEEYSNYMIGVKSKNRGLRNLSVRKISVLPRGDLSMKTVNIGGDTSMFTNYGGEPKSEAANGGRSHNTRKSIT